MKSNRRTHRLIVATLALGVGAGVLFLGHSISSIQRLDLAAVNSVDGSVGMLQEYDRETKTITFSSLAQSPDNNRVFQRVIVTDDPERIFENTPPSALDYAVILESLHNQGYRSVNFTTRLNWENEPGLLAAGLDLRLALFESSIIPLALTRGPQEGEMPLMLERSLIPHTRIHGDHKLVPLVNRTALTPQLTGRAKGVLAGFSSIEHNPPASGRVAMLARWSNKGMIPSYELLTLMQAHDVTPDQLEIHCGKHIRLGQEGPVITIDDYGQTKATTSGVIAESPEPIDADTIITQKKSDTIQTAVAMIHAQGKRTAVTNAVGSDRLEKIMTMTNAYPVPVESTSHRRLPLWAELIILLDTATIVFLLRGTSRGNQHLGFALTAALMLPLLYAMLHITQHWMAISVPLAVLISGWLLPHSSRRSTAEMPQYHTTDPKPVIRA